MPKIRFRRLGLFYLLALGCIALSIVVSQLLIQRSIDLQQDDARVINVAGRQRMLSQKISKVALKIRNQELPSPADMMELQGAVALWSKSHLGLQNGDSTLGLSGAPSTAVLEMFGRIEPHFQVMKESATRLLDSTLSEQDKVRMVQQILLHENLFLEGMDQIVFQYDAEARAKVSQLRKREISLFVISIVIILFELLFVFTPLARKIRQTVLELTESEEASKNMTREISKLYEELGKNYQDLEAVNMKPESAALYANMDSAGNFRMMTDRFLQMMEYDEESPPVTLTELLTRSGYRSDFIDGLNAILLSGQNWTGELRLITEPGDFCWLETYLIPTPASGQVKMIAREITAFKEAKMKSRELNRERIEKSVKEQQYRSALILEGQEEERKRLSRELHDGVGQMLSAMKMLLESMPPGSGPVKMRLTDAKGLLKSIIQEVRRVSFNLTPSSLDDFGLVAAVAKFCEEINHVSKPEITFINETRFINRLESNIETNLYRIIQEAVNNALKYAKATAIKVTFSHSIHSLSIFVEDNGRGFDYSRVESSGHFEKAGHGIFNMRERASYIGAQFSIDTSLENGTRISIILTLDKND